ncbi:MAG TPA: GTPase Era [Polyangiaceae bacterium]|nr:GTPase Era [Polyangiaceae bacterium]
MKSGSVAIVGRTNVGKSTLLNALLGEPLAIISPLPQTTRETLLGVLHTEAAQIAFIDTPGLHRPRSELGRRMNATALDALRGCDAIVFMTSVSSLVNKPKQPSSVWTPEAPNLLDEDDQRLLAALPKEIPAVLLLNKIDLLKNKRMLLPIMQAFAALHPFAAMVPISAKNHDGLQNAIEALAQKLPEQTAPYDKDTLTDRPTAFFVREYVREQILLQMRSEVPHAVAVTVDRFLERPKITEISATIHVEKDGQKAIVVGRGGSAIKQIGIEARKRLEQLLGVKIHLELFVRVTSRWKNMPRQLSELGYDHSAGRALSHLLPGAPKKRTKAKS